MDFNFVMTEEDQKLMREEPKTLSKNELAALREGALAMLKAQEEGHGKPSPIFLKGEAGATQCRPDTITNPRPRG